MELPNTSNNDSSLGKGILGSSKSVLPLPVAARMLVFTACMIMQLLVFTATLEQRRGMGIKSIKTPPKLAVFTELQLFFYNKHSSDFFASLFLIFRVLKKLILTIIASVLTTFMEEQIFNCPSSANLEYCPLLFTFLLISVTQSDRKWQTNSHTGVRQNISIVYDEYILFSTFFFMDLLSSVLENVLGSL